MSVNCEVRHCLTSQISDRIYRAYRIFFAVRGS